MRAVLRVWAPALGLSVLALLALATGVLPLAAAGDVLRRAAPVLGFLAAATALAGLADDAGVFRVAGAACARAARGSALRLWLLVALLATATTALLSLDTTAVLLTPVVLAVTAQADLPPLPFALLVVWLANTASLLLPVSNLTTLLAADRLGLGSLGYARRTALAELAAVAVTLLVLGLRDRAALRRRFAPVAPEPPADRPLLVVGAAACLLLGALVVAGAAPWVAALAAALVAAGGAVARGRATVLRPGLVPWRVLLLTTALFLVVEAVTRQHAVADALRHLVGHPAGPGGGGFPQGLRTAAVGAGLSNVMTNLPAYLALEPAVPAGDAHGLLALLVGTNAGPLLVLSGSLANLLWRERCAAAGLRVGAWAFLRVGLLGVPPVLVAAVACLR